MPVRNHTGTTLAVKDHLGRRCRVYVMGPSGLITIDPGVTFGPVSGNYSATNSGSVTYTINASADVVWTWTVNSSSYASSVPPSGSTASSLRLTVQAAPGARGSTTVTRVFTVTASGAGGTVLATYTISLTALGTAIGN